MPPWQPPDIDLDQTTEYQVQILRAADDAHPAGTLLYEGPTRFRLTPLPRVRSIPGRRYEVTPLAYDRNQGWQFPTDYQAGATMIVGPDDVLCIFLDRYTDPNRPYGPDGPTAREALEMNLDVFLTQNGLNGITWQ